MIELNGKYGMAKIYTDNVESSAIGQLLSLLNQPSVEGCKIRIMPDTHAGAGCVIGTTMTLKDKVIPNLVGVDIGCAVTAVKLKEKKIDMPMFDAVVRKYIPSGGNVHEDEKDNRTSLVVENLRCYHKKGAKIRGDLAYKSVGTLGGGNHFVLRPRWAIVIA